MAMYSFVPPFREATFCGVPSCVFDKSGCTTGEKRLLNTDLMEMQFILAGGPVCCSMYWLGRSDILMHIPRPEERAVSPRNSLQQGGHLHHHQVVTSP
jgi:hypothetical protein